MDARKAKEPEWQKVEVALLPATFLIVVPYMYPGTPGTVITCTCTCILRTRVPYLYLTGTIVINWVLVVI